MNQIDLKGRVGVVTGGARGIGYAIAQRLLESGASVSLWDVDRDAMAKAKAQLSNTAQLSSTAQLSAKGKVATNQVDITDAASVDGAVAATIAELGGLDILVNNAGIAGPTIKTWEYTPEQFRQVIEIDLVGPFICSRAVVPHMIKNGYGRIVNIASIAGKEGNANAAAYSAAKAGLIGFTKSLGKELATTGVMVNCVTPAAAKTDIFKQISQQHIDFMLSKIPMGRFLLVEEIGAMVAWLASEDCSFTTGGVFDISGGRAVY